MSNRRSVLIITMLAVSICLAASAYGQSEEITGCLRGGEISRVQQGGEPEKCRSDNPTLTWNTDPYIVGEIRAFAFRKKALLPVGWIECDGEEEPGVPGWTTFELCRWRPWERFGQSATH